MSRKSKTFVEGTSPKSKASKWEAPIQMGARLLLVLIGVLQVVAIVQSESPADTALHGGFLLVLIVLGTRKAKSQKSLPRRH